MKLIRSVVLFLLAFQTICYANVCEEKVELFSIETSENKAFIIKVNLTLLASIALDQPEHLNINLPISEDKSINLNVVKAPIFAENFKIINASGKPYDPSVVGVPYWGMLNGNKVATFIFLPDSVLGRYIDNNHVYEFQKINLEQYKLVNYNNDYEAMHCLTEDVAFDAEMYMQNDDVFIQDKIINVFIELDHEFPYLTTNGINKLAMVVFNFNQTALLFRNEEVTLKISEIFVWDTKSPYGGSAIKGDKKNPSMPQYLASFKKHRKSFNGDLALLFVDFSSYGNGIASKVGGLCSNKITDKMGVVKTYWDYATEYPKHTRGYKMVAHELGHLLGSGHTYNCSWNGNKTSLDNCRGRGKNCRDPRIDYDNRKDSDYTIMSYCETKSDLLKGFGVQSGNRMRQFVSNASCINTVNTWEETLVLHRTIESDYYETDNAKFKANTIHAVNQIKGNANAYIVAKDAIYLKEGFIAEEGSNVQLKITTDDIVVLPDNNTYETYVRTYSVDNVINDIIEDDTVESITIIDALGNALKTIAINSDEDYLDIPMFFNGFYMVKTSFKDGSVTIRKK